MNELDAINIPAYQRKRSIAAKARKKPSYLSALKPPKITKTRRARKAPTRIIHNEENSYSPLLDIPLRSINEGTDNYFTDPIIPEFSKSHCENREMKACGICEGYFEKIEVAVVKVTSAIRKGDTLIFEKQDGLFEQELTSMQINHRDVSLATTGSDIGLKVWQKTTVGGQVYKVIN